MKRTKPAKVLVQDEDDDDFSEDDDSPKPERSVGFENAACATRPAKIIRDGLNGSWRGSWVRIHLPSGPITPSALRKLIPRIAKVQQQLGEVFLEALVSGEREFPAEVKRAMHELDRLFDRTSMVELSRRVMPFSHEVDATEKQGRRALVEERLGKELYDQEWDRLQEKFGWKRPKMKSQRPQTLSSKIE